MIKVYKILRPDEWSEFQKLKIFSGSIHDKRDGFIHLSSANQLDFVIQNFFKDEPLLYIICFENLSDIKWEKASNGDSFPHLYNTLKLEDIVEVIEK